MSTPGKREGALCKPSTANTVLALQSVYGSKNFIPWFAVPYIQLAPSGMLRGAFAYGSIITILNTAIMLMDYVQNVNYDNRWSDFTFFVLRWVTFGLTAFMMLIVFAGMTSRPHWSNPPSDAKANKASVSAGERSTTGADFRLLDTIRWEYANRIMAWAINATIVQTLLLIPWWFIHNAGGSAPGDPVNYLGGPTTFVSTQANANLVTMAFAGALDLCMIYALSSIWWNFALWVHRNNKHAAELARRVGEEPATCEEDY